MRGLRTSLLLLCIVMMLPGCQKTPEEVKDRMKQYGENKQISSDDITYCSMDELKTTQISDLSVDLDNMMLPEKIDFSKIESIETLDMAFVKQGLEREDFFLEEFQIDRTSLIREEGNKEQKNNGRVYDNMRAKKYFAIEDNGWLSYVSGGTYHMVNSGLQQSIREKYDLFCDDISEKKVLFDGEAVSLSKICGNAEKCLGQYWPGEEYTYQISDAYIRELTDGGDDVKGTQVSLLAEALYKGISFNTYGVEIGTDGTNGKVNLMSYDINLNYEGENEITYLSNGTGCLHINSAQKIDQVVDFQSAVQIVNKEISGFNQLIVSKIIPLYALYPQYETKEMKFSEAGQRVIAKPVYAFIIAAEEEDSDDLGIAKENLCRFIFVDMTDGTLTTNVG